jgi:hypothetical protein
MSVITRDHTRTDHKNELPAAEATTTSDTSPAGETEWSHRRSIVERILWGSTTEHCAECGTELRSGAAYRDSMQNAYCSIEHAQLDRA